MQKQTHTFKFEILSSFSGLNSEIWLPLSSLTCRAIILDVITIAKVLMQPMHADDITCGESALATEKRNAELLVHGEMNQRKGVDPEGRAIELRAVIFADHFIMAWTNPDVETILPSVQAKAPCIQGVHEMDSPLPNVPQIFAHIQMNLDDPVHVIMVGTEVTVGECVWINPDTPCRLIPTLSKRLDVAQMSVAFLGLSKLATQQRASPP